MTEEEKIENVETEPSVRDVLEESYNATIISMNDLNEKYPEFYNWICTIPLIGKKAIILEKDDIASVVLFTNERMYVIQARLPTDDDNGILTASVRNRKQLAGEVWIRKNAIPNGEYNAVTWAKIISTIIAYELEDLQINIEEI